MGDPADSRGSLFGYSAKDQKKVWSVRIGSAVDRAFRSMEPDIEFALREAFLKMDKDKTIHPDYYRIFLVGDPSPLTPTILVRNIERLGGEGYRWRVRVGLNERRLFARFPGLEFGDYWPIPHEPGYATRLREGDGEDEERDVLAPLRFLPPSVPPTPGPLPSPPVPASAAGSEQSRRYSNSLTGVSLTIPDSGYGTASNAAASAKIYQAPATTQQNEANLSDVASVLTDNLSLDLPRDIVGEYIKAFAQHLLEAAVAQQPGGGLPASQLVDALPNLLRAFALRLAYAEDLPDGKAISTFTRQNKE